MVLAPPKSAPRPRLVLEALPKGRGIELVGHGDVLTAAACLVRADLFIGNDSGLMHLAAAVGIPTLGLFGPSPHERYRPWGPKAAYVRTPEDFMTLIAEPGYDRRTTGTLMDSLEVEAVLDAANALWAKAGRKRK